MVKWENVLEQIVTFGGILGASILTGKGIRRLLLWPFKWLASYTNTKEDDKIVEEIGQDLGVTPGAAEDNKTQE